MRNTTFISTVTAAFVIILLSTVASGTDDSVGQKTNSFDEFYENVQVDIRNSSNGTETEKLITRANDGLRMFAGVLTIFIIIFSIIGNGMTIGAVSRSPNLKTVASSFIVSLCVSDLTYSILAMPFFAARYLRNDADDPTTLPGLCVLIPAIQYHCVGASLMSLGLISVNRFVMIAFSKIYRRIYTRRNAILMIAGIWIFSFSMLIPSLAGKWGKFGYDSKMHYCSIIRDENQRSAKYALIGLGFFMPCVSIVLSYAGIFLIVHRNEARMRKHRRQAPPRINENDDAPPTSRFASAEKKLTRMILIVFLTFLICNLPYLIIKNTDKEAKLADLQIICYLLVYLSSCLNPLIYAVTNPQYRRAYAELAEDFKNFVCPGETGSFGVSKRRTMVTSVV